jgi:aspartyl-tRNA(Asn)/glutamyl-tRNA(Gln) amidotransferase subunit A
VFGLKPSLGRVPIKPPFAGRVAGPMTRSVADAALMMGLLSAPDARDSMSLPPQAIDWLGLERELKGLRLGLWLDAGWGLPLDPEVRAVIEAAAHAFARAGAIVEPLAAFTTREMADGIDRFWRLRSWLDISALPASRRARVLPFIVDWARGGAQASGEQVYRGWYQMHALREACVAATQPFDFVLSPVSPVAGYAAEWPGPTNDATRSLEHIGYTLPANMSEQPAASVNAGHTRAGMPVGLQIMGRRFDDLGVLQLARAWEQLRPAQPQWPEPPFASRH